jgi:hypothetical protein
MIVILGLVILVVAAVAGVGAVLGNSGHAHALTSDFSILGYHVTGSTGTLFLYGIVVGAVGMLGLSILLGGARRTSRRGSAARRGLKQSRRETVAVSHDRDDLIHQRETARADTASTTETGTPGSTHPSPDDDHGSWRQLFRRRSVPQQAADPQRAPATESETPVAEVPAEEPAPAQTAANGSRP